MEASLLGYFSHRGRERALAYVYISCHAMPAAGIAGHHHAASQQAQRTAVGKHRRGHRARLWRRKTVQHYSSLRPSACLVLNQEYTSPALSKSAAVGAYTLSSLVMALSASAMSLSATSAISRDRPGLLYLRGSWLVGERAASQLLAWPLCQCAGPLRSLSLRQGGVNRALEGREQPMNEKLLGCHARAGSRWSP